MIYSDKHNYLFIELPRTGSTAISNELQTNYDGISILKKHSTYRDFKKEYKYLGKKPFIFSCIRNPIDRSLSYYIKSKGGYYDYKFDADYKPSLYEKYYLLPIVSKIKQDNLTFFDFIKKFYCISYSDFSIIDHKNFNYIIRFEKLNEDFLEVLRKLNITPKRDLPVKNKTFEKKRDFEYYLTKNKHIKIIVKTFGPFMKRWKYNFPETWKYYKINKFDFFWFYFISFIIKIYHNLLAKY